MLGLVVCLEWALVHSVDGPCEVNVPSRCQSPRPDSEFALNGFTRWQALVSSASDLRQFSFNDTRPWEVDTPNSFMSLRCGKVENAAFPKWCRKWWNNWKMGWIDVEKMHHITSWDWCHDRDTDSNISSPSWDFRPSSLEMDQNGSNMIRILMKSDEISNDVIYHMQNYASNLYHLWQHFLKPATTSRPILPAFVGWIQPTCQPFYTSYGAMQVWCPLAVSEMSLVLWKKTAKLPHKCKNKSTKISQTVQIHCKMETIPWERSVVSHHSLRCDCYATLNVCDTQQFGSCPCTSSDMLMCRSGR